MELCLIGILNSDNQKRLARPKTMLLSLVIPTYNERQNIAILSERATQARQRSLDHFEIIVVDDDSPMEPGKRSKNSLQLMPTLGS